MLVHSFPIAISPLAEPLLTVAQAAMNESEMACKKMAGGMFCSLFSINNLLSDNKVIAIVT